jgi:hypothetical protein
MLPVMGELETTDYGIGEEEVTGSAPMVRALLVQRLEQIWSVCQPHVDGTVKPDPRFMEAGIRVLDRLARLYRLDSPLTAAVSGDLDLELTQREAAITQVGELEARMRADGV